MRKLKCPYCGGPLHPSEIDCDCPTIIQKPPAPKPAEISSDTSANDLVWLFVFCFGLILFGVFIGKVVLAEPTDCPGLECPAPEPCAETACPTFNGFDDEPAEYLAVWIDIYTDMQTALNLFTQIIEDETPDGPGYYATQCADIAERLGDDQFGDLYNGVTDRLVGLWPPPPYNASNPLMDSHARLLTAWNMLQKAVTQFYTCVNDEGRYVSHHTAVAENILRRAAQQLEFAETGYRQAIGR